MVKKNNPTNENELDELSFLIGPKPELSVIVGNKKNKKLKREKSHSFFFFEKYKNFKSPLV